MSTRGAREPISIEDEGWPVLVVRFSGVVKDEQFADYLTRYSTYLHRGERYALVLVTEPSAPLTKAKHARMQAEWIKDNYDLLQQRCLGIGFVLPAPTARGVLKAILSMQRLPMPYSVHAEEPDGRKWVCDLLIADGLLEPGTR